MSSSALPVRVDLDAPIYVAGHAGLVGSAVVKRLREGGFTNILTATRGQLDLRDQSEVSHWFKANRPEYVYPGGRDGRRDHGEQHAARRVHLRQHDDPRDGRPRRQGVRRHQAALPRLVVHLPPRGHPTDHRGPTPHRHVGTDERGVRDRQDLGHQALPGLPPAVRVRLHLRHADQPVRPERQLRPHLQPRAAGADPQVPRRPRLGLARRSRSGAPARRCASSSTSTISPTPACS